MRRILAIVFSLIIFVAFVKISLASEGTFELRSTNENNYKCFATSLQLQNLNYRVVISCRNIIFPVDETIFTYVLWANPVGGGKPFKLGSIGLGKNEFLVRPAFASLFITTEQNPNVKEPAGKVVMRGSIKPITFLEQTNQPEKETPKEEVQPTPTPTPKASVRDRLITGLKRAGLASGLALVAILGLVFVLTRPK